MKRRYKLRKQALVVLIAIPVLIVLLIIFLITHFKNKSYSIEYDINDYKISENYDSNRKAYHYEISYEDVKYEFISEIDYKKEKKLIEDITSKEENGLLCLYVESDYFNTNPLCSKDKQLVDYRIDEEQEDIKPTNISNYSIFGNVESVYLWTYKGLSYIEDNALEKINIFNQDIYELPLIAQINNYVVIPDYEQEYTFDTVYIINTNSNKSDKWEMPYELSFDSYFLGYNDESIFIVDRKNKIEYELVPHKKKMRILATANKDGVVYINGEETSVSMKKLVSNNYSFQYQSNYTYTVEDNILYLSYFDSKQKIKISNQEITSIIKTDKDKVYYLVKDTLYSYSIKKGEQKLITYSDWEFNYKNLIVIK